MKTEKFKKGLSLILAVIMLFTMMPVVGLIPEAEAAAPTMMQFTAASSGDFHRYWNKVYTVTFLDSIDTAAMNGAVESWDISADKNGSVMGWMYLNEEATAADGANRYDVYIAGEGGVGANPKSGFIFYMFSELVAVRGLEHFKTDAVTTFESLFENCYKLESVDFKNNNTENLTSMANMFKNCYELTELDLSSFNTSKVTTMRFAFYLCKKIEYIYVGDGWSLESIANLNDGVFNCCYAKLGVTEEQYAEEVQNGRQFDVSASKATTGEGGFLTYKAPDAPQKYKVTYRFEGETPIDAVAPSEVTYDEGSTVIVEDDADTEYKYIFNGWSTDDATVENGEFVINNDVEFVGSWTKLYQVKYEYDDNYELPAGAPEIPDTELWFAPGEDVPVYGVPYVPEYIFVGWNTGDAEVVGDSFMMPENDVVLYGYYKKPVNSIEISGGELTVDIGGEKVKVEVIIDPPDATFDGVIYESGDDSIVTVDKDGYLTPVSVGTTTITITSVDDPTKTDTVNVTVKIPVTDITVDRTEIDLNKGDADKITVTEVKPAEATNKEVTYESSDESVVKVDENGNIIAVGDGTATITVTSKDNKTVKEKVTVTVKTPVTELTVTEDFTLNVGEEKNVDAKVNEDATNKELIYEVDNPGVVKIDNDGNVIAVGEGTATITVTSKDDPSKKETVTVTVKVPVTGIEPEDKEITLTEGEKDKITVTVTPDNATNKEVTFESSDETVVKVDENGNIEAVGEGEATITVTSKDDPTKTETVKVTVNKKIFKVTYEFVGEVIPEGVTAPAMKEYKDGTTVKVEADSAAEGYIFSGWSTDDATVENGEFTITKDVHFIGSWTKINYYNVTYKYEGDIPADAPLVPSAKTYEEGTSVTVEKNPPLDGYTFSGWSTEDTDVKDGKFTISNDVEFIGKWVKNPVPVTDITVEKNEFTLEEGETDTIKVTVTPDDADNKEVTFESSDETVVKVDKDGNIEAVGEGEATITVTSKDDPTKKETVTVKVEKPFVPVTDITVEKNEFTLTEGETDTIKVTVTPDDADNKEVTFESSDETVVKVDENGNIEAVGEGEATITVTSKDDPTKKETVTVKVEKPFVPVTDITVEKNEFTLEEGETDTIKVTVTPDDADNKEVTFESSDETVVKVDENGNIEAVGEGEATITVTSKDDPSKKETVTVKVEKKEEPEQPENPDTPDEPEKPEYTIEVADKLEVKVGITELIYVKVTPNDGSLRPTFSSADESIAKVDEFGNVTGVSAGTTTIYVSFPNGEIRAVAVTVPAVVAPGIPSIPKTHHVCFGKTDGIGWYEVSVNGGDFFPQGPNSTLEVQEGSILVVRVQDMWIDDEFDFYVNGSKVPMDPANTITVVVDGYMLIGALSMDVPVPDVDESLTIFQRIVRAIKEFFQWIGSWFK